MQICRALVIGLLVLGWGAAAHAGWIIEESTVATRMKGDPSPPEPATRRVSEGRVRVTQPNVVIVQDSVKSRYTMLIPERNVYWTGSIDEYLKETQALAAQNAAGGPAVKPANGVPAKVPTLNPSSLPKIVIRKTDEQATLGGYDTTKYMIETDGRPFQEVWLTTAFNINSDLDPKKYVAFQAKLAAGMQGASAPDFNALYRSPEYLTFLSSGFPMKTLTRHASGTFTQEVRSVSRADIDDSEFSAPKDATRAALGDMFAPIQR